MGLSRRGLLRLGLGALGGGALGGAALAGCAPGARPVAPAVLAAATPTPTSASPAGTPFGLAPLTGLPAASAALADRPALVVDLWFAGAAPAPTGLDRADLVFEEVTGAGARRLMAVYQSRDAPRIGPVADTWPSDIRNLPLLHPLVASRGGPAKFATVLGSTAGLTDVSYPRHSGAYSLVSGVRSPYNVVTSSAALYALAPAGAAPPPGVLPVQENGLPLATTGVVAAGRVTVTVPGEPAVVWSAGAAGWQRQGSSGLAYPNLAVLVMPYRSVPTHNNGPSVRTAAVYGSGAGWLAAGRQAVRGSWSRKGAFGAALIVDAAGVPARAVTGSTWIFYAPSGSTVTVS